MITRGYYIGAILDDLSGIASQVDTRCTLGLTDLNIYLENFFKDVLNIILKSNLKNLNEDRNNEPGLDLGDEGNGIAFQITSQKNSAKINSTLEKITDAQLEKYTKIFVLVIGKKQTSYTLDQELLAKVAFKESNIWDIKKLLKKTMDLPLDQLHALHELIRRERVRVTIELELPTSEGKYPTSFYDYMEKIPKPHMSDLKSYYEYHNETYLQNEQEYLFEDVKHDFALLAKQLAKLPRVSREALAYLIENSEKDSWGGYIYLISILKRQTQYKEIEEELRILEQYRFLSIDTDSEPESGIHPHVRIRFLGKYKTDEFFLEFIEYIENKHLDLKKPIVHLDFRDF